MNRRQFLQLVSGAVAAIAAPRTPDLPAVVYTESPLVGPAASILRNGIEIVEGAQPLDADYLQINVIRWINDRLVAKQSLRFTNAGRITERKDIKAWVDNQIQEAVKQMELIN